MTDEIFFPPLFDVPQQQLEAQKQHLLSAIASQPERRRLALPSLPRLRLRFAVPVLAVIGAAAFAVVFTGTLGGSGGQRTTYGSGASSLNGSSGTNARVGGHPLGFMPINLNITRNGQAITSIAVTVNSSVADATLQLQVLRTQDSACPACSSAQHQVVFQEQVPMNNIASPANGPPGTVALSTWSGTISPSDWDGGCQNAFYSVAPTIVPKGSSFDNSSSPGSESGESEWFNCSGAK